MKRGSDVSAAVCATFGWILTGAGLLLFSAAMIDPAALVSFPVFAIARSAQRRVDGTLDLDGLCEAELEGGARSLLLFTDNDRATRFVLDKALGLVTVAGFHDPSTLLAFLKNAKGNGFSHVTFDPWPISATWTVDALILKVQSWTNRGTV